MLSEGVNRKIEEVSKNRGDSSKAPEKNYYLTSPFAENIDVHGLEAALRKRIRGEVRFDEGSRALYSTDGSNYRQIPIGVVLPATEEDILDTIALCREYGAPVLSRGGG